MPTHLSTFIFNYFIYSCAYFGLGYVYICRNIYTLYMHIYIYGYLYYIYIYICIYIYIIYLFIFICVYLYLYIYICMYIYMYIHKQYKVNVYGWWFNFHQVLVCWCRPWRAKRWSLGAPGWRCCRWPGRRRFRGGKRWGISDHFSNKEGVLLEKTMYIYIMMYIVYT